MTRRGSLVYYLAAVVCGCFFAALVLWAFLASDSGFPGADFRGFRGFIFVSFLCLSFGAVPALLFALVLRLVASALGWKHVMLWLMTGAVVAPPLAWALSEASKALGLFVWGELPPRAPIFWMAIPVGAATASVLNLIDRVFRPHQEASELMEHPGKSRVD